MYDLAIIGAGPAGMAAALSASDAGLSVVVVDEQTRAGGQIFRQPPVQFQDSRLKPTAGYGWATGLIARFEGNGAITKLFSTTAYGILRDREESGEGLRLAVSGPSAGGVISARRLLIATGAYDLPVAFPGWTLPGVMTAGAVQSLLKSQRVLASENLVLAGSHPLLIVVADQLRTAGAHVSEVAFARGIPTPREILDSRQAAPGHFDLFAETGMALVRLRAAGTRISTRTIITAALGERHVASAELAKVDKSWTVSERRRCVDTSMIVLGYGFSPSTELARQAGCDMEWDSAKGGWIVKHDHTMATSMPDIYVAGEPTGVAGAEQSRAEGHLAGLQIARDLESLTGGAAMSISVAERSVAKAATFSHVVQQMFEPNRLALGDLATPQTIICRCELVTRHTVDEVLEDNPFISTSSAVKLQCRSGMGACQGRYCEGTVGAILARTKEQPLDECGHYTAHLPVKPVPVETLTSLTEELPPRT